jgi:hypothetical protein
MQPLPAEWSSGRSMAALIGFAGTFTGDRLTPLQLDLARWELEKYGPAYHEPFAEIAIEAGITQLASLTPSEGRQFAVLHGSEILRRRGREAVDLAISACARVAALGPRPNQYLDAMLFDVSAYARGEVSMGEPGREINMGNDELQDFTLDHKLPIRPTPPELAAQTQLSMQLLDLPPTWTPAHAIAFLITAAHFTDRAPVPLPERATKLVESFANVYNVSASPGELLAHGDQLYRRCNNLRFVVMRVVEDQVMRFASLELDVRTMVLQVVNSFAADLVTPWRRAIVTATMAVLATSPKAMVRPRHCPAVPVLR